MTDDPADAPETGFPSTPTRAAMPGWYPELLASVAGHVVTGHRRAVAAANAELLAGYWRIGTEILARQQEEGYGAKGLRRSLARRGGCARHACTTALVPPDRLAGKA